MKMRIVFWLLFCLMFLGAVMITMAQTLPCAPTSVINKASCHNTTDGYIHLFNININATFLWSNGDTGMIADSLGKGWHSCTMSYAGLSRTDNYYVDAYDELKTGRQPRQNPVPVGTTITINPSGGSGAISATWIFVPLLGNNYFFYGGFPILTSYTPTVQGILYIRTFSDGCVDNEEKIFIQ